MIICFNDSWHFRYFPIELNSVWLKLKLVYKGFRKYWFQKTAAELIYIYVYSFCWMLNACCLNSYFKWSLFFLCEYSDESFVEETRAWHKQSSKRERTHGIVAKTSKTYSMWSSLTQMLYNGEFCFFVLRKPASDWLS